jgi:predicted ribosomally synthesized peptide with nif11-like leader
MSEEQLKAFLEAVKADATLQEKLKVATDAGAVVALAKDVGFVISAEEIEKAHVEILEEELEGVSGGTNALQAANVLVLGEAPASAMGVLYDGNP